MTGNLKGTGNQYIQLVKVLYCKLPTNGKQLRDVMYMKKQLTGPTIWPKGVLVPEHERKAIRDASSALELTKVWLHKEIPTQTHPTDGLEPRRSPIQVLT